MRRPSAFLAKHEEETSDSLSTVAPNSANAYLDDSVSPFLQDNSNESDSETLSTSSKKIKKKRSTYQKIPDDIRINLLDCVKNGETLKAAAKRFKINYSSAKSILHTYRKEGRILKKPAQERTTKKKALAALDNETPTKAPKQTTKKDRVKETENNASVTPKSLAPLSERANSQGLDTKRPSESPRNKEVHGENMYHKTSTTQVEDFFQTSQPETQHHHHHQQQHHADHHYNQSHFQNDFFAFQNEDPYHDPSSFMFSKDFTSSYLDEDKFFRADNDAHFEQGNEGFDNCPLKSFMDTQKLLQDAFRKTSFSYNENNGGYRKGSVDFFF